VLRSRRLGGVNRLRVRSEDAQAILDQLRWKDLNTNGPARQASGNLSLRSAFADNLNRVVPREFTGPYDLSVRRTLVGRVQRCGCGQVRDECRHCRREV